jgi:uncharacterized protein YndB with AHSA1/START domain
MIDFTVETQIARPVHDVFAYATDPDRLPSWQDNTVSAERMDDGPLGVGSRLREVHRAPGGKELESIVEVVRYEPDRVFALEVREGPPIHGHLTFDPADGGTRVRFRAHGSLTGPTRLIQPLVGRMLRKQFARQVATLKRVLEDAPVAASTPR